MTVAQVLVSVWVLLLLAAVGYVWFDVARSWLARRRRPRTDPAIDAQMLAAQRELGDDVLELDWSWPS